MIKRGRYWANKYKLSEKYTRDAPPLKPADAVVTNRGIQGLQELTYRICQEAGIEVVRGRWNKQCIYLGDIAKLLKYLKDQYRPTRNLGFDRLSLTMWMTGADVERQIYKRRPSKAKMRPGYARRLELEIERIADLEQPMRSIAATEFLRRIQASYSVALAAKQYLKEDGIIRGVREEREISARYLIERLKELQETARPYV